MLTRSFLFVILVNIILCEITEDDIEVNVKPRQFPVYSYNHPPLYEESEDHVLKARQIRPEHIRSLVSDTTFNDNSALENNLLFNLGSPESNINIRKKRDEAQIPVAVVYQDDGDSKSIIKANSTKVRRRKQRKQQTGKKDAIPIGQDLNVNTEKTTSVRLTVETITTTIKPTTQPLRDVTLFPKRSEEDNKRIQFQKRPKSRPNVVKILNEENFVYAHSGNFHYSYNSEDGTKISSRGELLKNDKNEGTGEAVIGNVSYKDKDGHDISLSYTADENGYRPIGSHLPTPPPIPPAIERALKYLATKKPDAEENTTEKYKKTKL